VPDDDRLVDELAGTLAAVFPEVRVWPVLRFNHIVVGSLSAPVEVQRQPAAEPLRQLGSLLDEQLGPAIEPSDDPWTDDHAPVEWVTDRMIVSYASRGGDLDEPGLPTAP
jgi:hypothetical protein